MKIVVLGAGRVGGTLVAQLMQAEYELTVVDTSNELLQQLQASYDIRVIQGNAAHPNVLSEAGLSDADMLIAVTTYDETNIIACMIARYLFKVPKRIARVRTTAYFEYEVFQHYLPIDICINPEELVTTQVKQLINYPGAFAVLNFANEQLTMFGMRVSKAGPLVGKLLTNIYSALTDYIVRVVAIYRDGRSIPVRPQTAIIDKDEVFFLSKPSQVKQIINMFGPLLLDNKKVILAGGGNIGAGIAAGIESEYMVKVIEMDKQVSLDLTKQLNNTLVLYGNAQDGELLIAEGIENTDIFCAVTNDDEANILASMQAKRLGARTTYALINRKSYINLLDNLSIDVVIAPAQITLGSILRHIRHQDIHALYSLRGGSAEAMEIIIQAGEHHSKVIGVAVNDLSLPVGVEFVAVVRNDQLYLGDLSLTLQADDRCIIFVTNTNSIQQLEELFFGE